MADALEENEESPYDEDTYDDEEPPGKPARWECCLKFSKTY
jgi:hypothetical protein